MPAKTPVNIIAMYIDRCFADKVQSMEVKSGERIEDLD